MSDNNEASAQGKTGNFGWNWFPSYTQYRIQQQQQQQLIDQEQKKYDEDVAAAKAAVEAEREKKKKEARNEIEGKGWSQDRKDAAYRKRLEEIDADYDKKSKEAENSVSKGENLRRYETEKRLDKVQEDYENEKKEKSEESSKDGEKDGKKDGEKDGKKDGDKSSKEKESEEEKTSGTPVSTLAAQSIGAYLGKNVYDVKDPMGRDAALKAQSNLHVAEAGEHRAAAQRENHIATRDARREAGKDGLAESASKNEQKVMNKGNASAGAAALEREEFYGDPNTHRNRADQARQKGVENTEKAYDEDQVAIQERNAADVYNYKAKETAASNIETDALSKGDGDKGGGEVTTKKTEEDTTPKTSTETITETQKFEPQKALNYMTYSLDPSSKQNPNNKATNPDYVGDEVYAQGKQYATTKMEGDATWTDAVQAEATKGPITPDEVKAAGKDPNNFPGGSEGEGWMQDLLAKLRPNWYKWWQGMSDRFDEDGNQKNRGDVVDGEVVEPSEMGNTETTSTKTVTKDENGNIVQGGGTGGTGSDYRVKSIVSAIAYDPKS